MKRNLYWPMLLVVALSLVLSACGSIASASNGTNLEASGTFSARSVNVSSQIGGEVVSISVEEGQQVKAGDELFRLDDSQLNAQRQQAEAAVQVAETALNSAQIQYDLTLNQVRMQDLENRVTSWEKSQPDEFDLPVWYFDQEEQIASALVEIDAAKENLEKEEANLEKVLADAASQEFLDAERKVADAQAAFLIADQVLTQAKSAQDNEDLEDYAQQIYDAAEIELEAAQGDYDRLLTTTAGEDVLEARARVKVAQERYDRALDYHNSLLTEGESLQVEAAQAGVQQAEAAVAQSQAALAAIDVQLEKTVVTAPMDGIVFTRNLEVGETLAPGGVVITIGQLEEVELVVYIPETEYGQVHLGDQVSITVDSFPGETFTGSVVHISDQAEFTPRNVQTVEGRRATVYAVKLSVPNQELKLKPGMPADVTFLAP